MHPRRPHSVSRIMNYEESVIPGPSLGNGYDSSPYQSTPRKDDHILGMNYAPTTSMFGQSKPPVSILSRSGTNSFPQKFSSGMASAAQRNTRSPSPSKLSPTKFTDVEGSTIQRQRKELQLLINELKDRDRELNEMVDSHQKQLISWETDKKRVLVLERHVPKLRADLKKRTEQVRILKERLRIVEQNAHLKTKELETTQIHLQQASDQANISSHQVEELKDRNENMANSIKELSTALGQLQAREQEVATTLKLKENDLVEANGKINDLAVKVKSLHNSLQESRKNEAILKTERDQWKEQHQANKHEVEKLRADISNHYNNEDEYQSELSQVKQDLLTTQKELFLAGEREKRKDQLVELSKSKQERTEAELQHLRQVFERQQRELLVLQQQFQEQDLTDRMSDLNTDDDISDISTTVRSRVKLMDDPLHDFNDVNYQEAEKITTDFTDLYNTKERTSYDTMASVPTYKRSSIGRVTSNDKKRNTRVEEDKPTSTNGSYIDSSNIPKAVNNDSTTEKLQKLLEESRQMVNSLEGHSPISSINSTPDKKDIRNLSTEQSFSTPQDKKRRSPLLDNSLDIEDS